MECSTAVTIWGGFMKRRAIAIALVAVAVAVASVAMILTYADWWEVVLAFSCFWMLFLATSLPPCLVVWFLGRRRVQWNKLDFLILVLPYATWMILAVALNLSKSMANAAVEPLYLGLAVALAPIIRLVLSRSWNGIVPRSLEKEANTHEVS